MSLFAPAAAAWRDADAYAYLQDLSPAGLAWECLRRNPDYRRDFADQPTPPNRQAQEAFTDRWGLRFPDRSRSKRFGR